MTQTVLAKAPWPKVIQPKPRAHTQKPNKRLDEKFEAWAKRNNVDLKELGVMR